MAANPGQGDPVVSPLPKNSPEEQDAKIQNLEREMDLLKTSIKRLLMDIRERMNETENPFMVASVPGGRGPRAEDTQKEKAGKNEEKTARNSHEAQMDAVMEKAQSERQKPEQERAFAPAPASSQAYANQPPAYANQPPQYANQPPQYANQPPQYANQPPQYANQPPAYPAQMPPPIGIDRRVIDDQLVAQYKAQASGVRGGPQNSLPGYSEKFRLQKVYKLFKWTSQAVRKYGHDRLEIILQSYKAMGYISKDSFEEIKEVAKLMPASLGEEHEVGPDEYVSELYTLNRIIAPDDISLDRDMIELMMDQRSLGVPLVVPSPSSPPVPRIEYSPTLPAQEKKPAKNTEMEEDWMNLPDRI